MHFVIYRKKHCCTRTRAEHETNKTFQFQLKTHHKASFDKIASRVKKTSNCNYEKPTCLQRSRFDFIQLNAMNEMNTYIKKAVFASAGRELQPGALDARCEISKKRRKQRVSQRIIFAAISHTHKTMRASLWVHRISTKDEDVRANPSV